MQDLREESEFIKEIMLRKLVFNELDASSLARMWNHFENLQYAIGRLDGEKYIKGEVTHEQRGTCRKAN